MSEFARWLLDNEWIQRLRFIRQTNVTFIDFPNLAHTRFQHILGTYHIGMKMMDNTDSLSQSKKIKKIDKQTNVDLIFFSLCHHIFEPPFSDIGSEVICYLKNKNNDEINNAIERLKEKVKTSIEKSLRDLADNLNILKKVLSPLFPDNEEKEIEKLIQKGKTEELINEKIIRNKEDMIGKLSVLNNAENNKTDCYEENEENEEINKFLKTSLLEILKSNTSKMEEKISSLFESYCKCPKHIIDFIEKSKGLLDQIFNEKYLREPQPSLLSEAVISPYGLSKTDGLSMDSFYFDGNCLQGIRELIDSIFLIEYKNSYKGENKQKKFGIAIEKDKISHLGSLEDGRRFIAERIFHDKTLRKRRKILGRMLYRLLVDHPELLQPENYKHLVDDSVIAIFSGDIKLEDIFEEVREAEEENYRDYGWIFGNIDDETEKKRILDYRFVLKLNEEKIDSINTNYNKHYSMFKIEKILSNKERFGAVTIKLLLEDEFSNREHEYFNNLIDYLWEKSDIEFYIFQLDNCDANQKEEINKKIFKNILWKKLEYDFTKRLREFEICDSLEEKIGKIETDEKIGDVFCALDCPRLTKSVFWPKGAELKNRVINNEYYFRFPSLDECNKEELEYVTFRIYVAKRNGECFDRNEDKDKDIPNKIYKEIENILIKEYLEKEKYLVLQCDTYILDISLFASDIIDFKKFKEAYHNSTSDIELKIPDIFIWLVKTDKKKAADFIIKYCEIGEDKRGEIIKILADLSTVIAQNTPQNIVANLPFLMRMVRYEFRDHIDEFIVFVAQYLFEIQKYLTINGSENGSESHPEFKKSKYHLISFSNPKNNYQRKTIKLIEKIMNSNIKIKDTTQIAPFSAPAWIKEYSEKKFRFIKKFINRNLFKNEGIGFYLLNYLSKDANCFIPSDGYYLFDGIQYLLKEKNGDKINDTDIFIRPQNFPLQPPLDEDEKSVTLNGPIFGVIKLRESEYKLLKSRMMHRLSRIKQTSFVDFVYPSAIHTRLQHSLGVMYLADWAFCSIELRQGHSNIIKPENLPDKEKENFKKARQFIRVAALIHDIGHGPLSHLSEQLITILSESEKNNGLKMKLSEGKKSNSKEKIHENNTKLVLEDASNSIKEDELRKLIKNCFKDFNDKDSSFAFLNQVASLSVGQLSDDDVKTIKQTNFFGKSSNDRYNYWDLRWLNPLLAGKYDVDRIDYHIRDIFFTGTNYCATDYKRILGKIFNKNEFWEVEVDSNKFEDFKFPDKVPFISIREDRGLGSLEVMDIQRVLMYFSILLHFVVRSITALTLRAYLSAIFQTKTEKEEEYLIGIGNKDKFPDFYKDTDYIFLLRLSHFLKKSKDSEDYGDWIENILKRKIFKKFYLPIGKYEKSFLIKFEDLHENVKKKIKQISALDEESVYYFLLWSKKLELHLQNYCARNDNDRFLKKKDQDNKEIVEKTGDWIYTQFSKIIIDIPKYEYAKKEKEDTDEIIKEDRFNPHSETYVLMSGKKVSFKKFSEMSRVKDASRKINQRDWYIAIYKDPDFDADEKEAEKWIRDYLLADAQGFAVKMAPDDIPIQKEENTK